MTLLQDECRELSIWLSTRIDSRWVFRRHHEMEDATL